MEEKIIILDFYSQFNQLIARRVRECNVYSEILPHDTTIEVIRSKNPKGIILTGGPASVYLDDARLCDPEIFNLGIPVLGICYGMQLMSHMLGGKVGAGIKKEYGVTDVSLNNQSKIFKDFENENKFLMSHFDIVEKLPKDFNNIAHTKECPIAAIANEEKKFYGNDGDCCNDGYGSSVCN